MTSVAGTMLEVRELTVAFPAQRGVIRAVDRVSFSLDSGRTLGLVGESGCGKSMTLRALMGLVPAPGEVVGGSVALASIEDLLGLRGRALEAVRGAQIAMVFQDPMSALDPVLSVGDQMVEVLRLKAGLARAAARARALDLLELVGIPAAQRRIRDYPHQLSGGMRQRVAIALAVAADPILLLADEPTTALDVTIQDQILLLLQQLQEDNGMAIVLVSHDLGVIAQYADDVAVMYAGRIVEYGAVDDVLDQPRHPYTQALMSAVPQVEPTAPRSPLRTIGGQPPDLAALPQGCTFAPRCPYSVPACGSASMALDRPIPEHGTGCIRPEVMAEP